MPSNSPPLSALSLGTDTERVSKRRCPNLHRRPSSDATALISVHPPTTSTPNRSPSFSRSCFSPNQPKITSSPALRRVRFSQSSRTRSTLWSLLSTNWATVAPAGSLHSRVPGFQVRAPASNRIGLGYQANTPSSIEQPSMLPSQLYSSQAGETSNSGLPGSSFRDRFPNIRVGVP